MATLLIVGADGTETRTPIFKSLTTIGSDAESDVVVSGLAPSAVVRGEHASDRAKQQPWRGLSDMVSPQSLTRARAVVAALKVDALDEHVERCWPVGFIGGLAV